MKRKAVIPKVTRPALAGVHGRARLFRRVEALSRTHPIIWVSAPGGSGKTTLAASFVEARRCPCVWYQLDARDADPAAFFYYLRSAVGRIAPRRPEPLPLLTPEYSLGLSAYTSLFFEQVSGRLPPRGWLVLDDYQSVPEGSVLHTLLPAGLGALAATARVLVLSRAAPPAPFARLLAQGAIGLMGAEDLNLTAAETKALAAGRVGRRLTTDAAEALRAVTGGWLAGTVLLLDARLRNLPARRGVETEERQVLFDYFAAEIFDEATPEAQRLLLRTAMLPELSVGAAQAVAEEPGAGGILSDLVRRNYFTFRLDGPSARYRIHPLFREFLLSRARESLDPEEWRRLARRSADALVADGDADTAGRLLAETASWEALADLTCRQGPTLAAQGRLATLESWIRAMPASWVERSAWLSFWAGSCALPSPVDARRHLERAFRTFRDQGDVPSQLVAWAALVSTYFFVWDVFAPLDPWIAEMERLRAAAAEFPSVDVEAHVTLGMLASLMWRNSGHPSLGHWVGRATALLDSDASAGLRVQLAAYLSFYWANWRGDLDACDEVLARLRAFALASDVTPLTQAFWLACEAHQHARHGDPVACTAAVERGLEIAGRAGIGGVMGLIATQGAYGGLAAGDLALAARYVEMARRHVGPGERANVAHNHQLAAWIALCAGEIDTAQRHATAALALAKESGAELAVCWCEHTLAQVLIERAERGEAVRLLRRCIQWAEQVGHRAVMNHALLSIAYAHLSSGYETEGLEELAAGFRIGREEAYVAPIWIGWRRDVMARLAALALHHGIECAYVEVLIRRLGLRIPDGARCERWPWSLRVEVQGGLRVLRDGRPIEFPAKVPRKTLELLRLVVDAGERGATLGQLADALWPEADGDVGLHALETAIYRLRRLLGDNDALVRRAGRVMLDPGRVFVDAWAVRASRPPPVPKAP